MKTFHIILVIAFVFGFFIGQTVLHASKCSAGVGNIDRIDYDSSRGKYAYITDNDYRFYSDQIFRIGDPIEITYYCNATSIITSIHYQN